MIRITLQSGWNSNVGGLFSSALLIRLTRWWNVIAWKIRFWYMVNHFWNDNEKAKKKPSFLDSLLGHEIENILFWKIRKYLIIILLTFKPLGYLFLKEDKVFWKFCYKFLYIVYLYHICRWKFVKLFNVAWGSVSDVDFKIKYFLYYFW